MPCAIIYLSRQKKKENTNIHFSYNTYLYTLRGSAILRELETTDGLTQLHLVRLFTCVSQPCIAYTYLCQMHQLHNLTTISSTNFLHTIVSTLRLFADISALGTGIGNGIGADSSIPDSDTLQFTRDLTVLVLELL